MQARTEAWGPISLRPIAHQRIWGVEALPAWYAQPAPAQRIGEVWLTAMECIADSAAVRGRTLAQLVKDHPQSFASGGAKFPLLIKLLFPREKLSVQVHPDDAQARELGEPHGKSECWYVLNAEPRAAVALGFREPSVEAAGARGHFRQHT